MLRENQARMPTRVAAALAVTALITIGAGCSSDDTPTTTAKSSASAGSSACRDAPTAHVTLDWLPADLPLPDGSYATQDLDTAGPPPTVESTTHRGLLVVKGSVENFREFVNTQWVAAGYSLGKGDAEQGEAEGGYRKGEFGGAFRARDVYCDHTLSELLLVYGPGAGSADSDASTASSDSDNN